MASMANNQLDMGDAARAKIGELVDNGVSCYQIIDILGYGTYGCIYLGKDIRSTESTASATYKAIKCLSKKGLAPHQMAFQRQEIELHQSAGYHPNIVTLESVVDTPDYLYLVLEYCSGGDLYEAIIERHSPSYDSGIELDYSIVSDDTSVKRVFYQIMDALDHCHSNGIYHRDLKPENILIASDGSIKLADFGLATTDKASKEFGCGSSFYMAPEQQNPEDGRIMSKPSYSPAKSDVWALGIILLNLRFGRNPWKQSHISDNTYLAFSRNPRVLLDMFPLTSEAFQLLERILCVNPNERCDLDELRRLLDCVERFSNDDESDVATTNQASNEDRSLDEDSLEVMMFSMDEDLSKPHCRRVSSTSGIVQSTSISSPIVKFPPASAPNRIAPSSWSELVEDEMDFSVPVEFDEPPSTAPKRTIKHHHYDSGVSVSEEWTRELLETIKANGGRWDP